MGYSNVVGYCSIRTDSNKKRHWKLPKVTGDGFNSENGSQIRNLPQFSGVNMINKNTKSRCKQYPQQKQKKQHHKLLNYELCLPFYLRATPQEASTQKGMISPPSLGIGVWLGVLGITGKQLRRWILTIQPPQTNECPLKINGWFRCTSYWNDAPFFRGHVMLVFRGNSHVLLKKGTMGIFH